ncbi:MAG: ZIP family metal transporter [Desulfobacterales bacterium]
MFDIVDPIAFIVAVSVIGPVLGSAIGIIKCPSSGYICSMLCFAAGVMLAISFLELIPESIALSSIGGCVFGFMAGAFAMYGVDRILPHIHPQMCSQEQGCSLQKTSAYLIIGIAMHNFPEGMAIAGGAVANTKVSLVIALAIAIHCIPEGICTAASYFYTTGNRIKSFFVSASTALPILIGYALVRYLFINIEPYAIGVIIGATAGFMIYITTDELIPNSCVGSDHRTIFALMAGVIFVILLGLI